MKTKSATIAAAAALLAACQTRADNRAAEFVCDRSGPLSVAYMNDVASVRVGGETYRLPAMRSASGARYGDGRHQFWSKGDTATWITGRMAPDNCRLAVQPR